MNIEIIIPHVGETTTTVYIGRWLKKVGDTIKKGEPILEIETDKSTIEIEALADGVLQSILIEEGDQADAMQVVGIITGQERTAVTTKESKPGSEDFQRVVDSSITSRLNNQTQTITNDSQPSARDFVGSSVHATPKARRLAREHGFSLEDIKGSGIDGMVCEADVEAFLANRAAGTTTEGKAEVPLTPERQMIAIKMQKSKQTIPHFYLWLDVDMTQVNLLRDYCHQQPEWDQPPSYTDILIRVVAMALGGMPEVNIIMGQHGIIHNTTVNIGVAVSHPKGLQVPVITNADKLRLREITVQTREKVERARAGRLRDGDITSKNMVISNLGMYGVDAFLAIIDPPDAMILAAGKVMEKVVAINGQPAVRPMCTLSLSADHRVLDGITAAQFLLKVKTLLEYPYEMMRLI